MKILLRISVLSILFSIGIHLAAQDEREYLPIHQLVGNSLDFQKIKKYKLGSLVGAYWSKPSLVRYYRNDRNQLTVEVYNRRSKEVEETKVITFGQFDRLRRKIDKEGGDMLERLQVVKQAQWEGDSVAVRIETYLGKKLTDFAKEVRKDSLILSNNGAISISELYILQLIRADLVNKVRKVDEKQAIEIHPMVGYSLEYREIRDYRLGVLFNFFWNVKTRIFIYEDSDSALVLRAYQGESMVQRHEELISLENLKQIRQRIEREAEDMLATLEEIQKNLDQGDTVYISFSTQEGYKNEGRVTALENSEIILANGESLPYANLKTLRTIWKGKIGYLSARRNPPTPDRMFAWQNAYTPKRGELYYKNTLITVNSLHYGINKNLSVSGGLEGISTLFSTLNGIGSGSFESFQAYGFADVKASFQLSEETRLAAGILAIGGVGSADYPWIPLPYVIATFGSETQHISVGATAPFNYANSYSTEGFIPGTSGFQWVERRFTLPPITVTGIKQINTKLSFLLEAIYYGLESNERIEDDFGIISQTRRNTQALLLSGGARWKGKRIYWDFGAMIWGGNVLERTESLSETNITVIPIPYLAASYRLR